MTDKIPSFKPLMTQETESKTQIVIANSIEKIVEYFNNITDFNSRELKAMSILMTNKYYANLLKFYIENKKHVKRKHAKEIMEALKIIAEASKIDNEQENELGFLKRLRGGL